MKLTSISQCNLASIDVTFDIVIAASGYESRARYLAEHVNQSVFSQDTAKIVFSFVEHVNDCARPENDRKFHELGYRSIVLSGKSDEGVPQELLKCIDMHSSKKCLNILIDISSMTRSWYGSIVRILTQKSSFPDLDVYFSYTSAEFIEPSPEYPPNRVVGPVPGFTGNALPDLPTALIIGLGYDRDRALGLQHYLDPQLTHVFSANPSSDPKFVDRVNDFNSELFNHLKSGCRFDYPIFDWVNTFKTLESVSNGLKRDWRVVLCSLGPKTFGLCCFLVASLHRELSIWRVSADHHEDPKDLEGKGDPAILKTRWLKAT